MSGLSLKQNNKPVYQYRPHNTFFDNVPKLSIEATILIFDDDLVNEERHSFSSRDELTSYANERAAYEIAHGHQIKVIWKESLTCQGSMVWL